MTFHVWSFGEFVTTPSRIRIMNGRDMWRPYKRLLLAKQLWTCIVHRFNVPLDLMAVLVNVNFFGQQDELDKF